MKSTADQIAGFNARNGSPWNEEETQPVRLRAIALRAIAVACAGNDGAEFTLLAQFSQDAVLCSRAPGDALADALMTPDPADAPLAQLARDLRLSRCEVLAIALAAAVEDDPLIGRFLAQVQAPVGSSRPTLGLLSTAFADPAGSPAIGGASDVIADLLSGNALKTGLLAVLSESMPLCERPMMVPTPLCLALAQHDGCWFGIEIGLPEPLAVPLPESIQAQARQHAAALGAESHRTLVIRTSSSAEGRSVAADVARALGKRPAFVKTDKIAGLGPWLVLRSLIPVFCVEPGPGERRMLPQFPGYAGPILALAGPDGTIESEQGSAASWAIPVPSRTERVALWRTALHESSVAEELGRDHRHGIGRIAHLGRLAHYHASFTGRSEPNRNDVIAAAWSGEGSGLESLAQPLRAQIPDEALIVTPELRADLEELMLRCRVRDDLAEGLGASAAARYRAGVRALFTGPSGTGKTLAAGWIATKLGVPLYRVDLASVTSKYIGETEKNLAQLLACAEQAEVILLFDEADSLFGKRTDISDSNDRFANAQTNYLLQRIETYDGIVILTSNSQARFDPAFARRLDFVVEFPAPGPEERRAIWRSHLDPETTIGSAEINELAARVDLSGGHIRNAVLAAAARARRDTRKIAFADLVAGLEIELRKLGRQIPVELKTRI
jgi:hypothetical protein